MLNRNSPSVTTAQKQKPSVFGLTAKKAWLSCSTNGVVWAGRGGVGSSSGGAWRISGWWFHTLLTAITCFCVFCISAPTCLRRFILEGRAMQVFSGSTGDQTWIFHTKVGHANVAPKNRAWTLCHARTSGFLYPSSSWCIDTALTRNSPVLHSSIQLGQVFVSVEYILFPNNRYTGVWW